MISIVVPLILASFAATQPAPKCCTVDQWEGFESEVAGVVPQGQQAVVIDAGMAVHYDGTNQKIAAEGPVTTGGQTVNVNLIQDYSKKLQYVIINSNNCTKSPLGNFKKACVPGDATLMGNYYFGGKAQNLPITAYQMIVQNLQVQVGVTSIGCYPVEEIIVGQTGGVDVSEVFNFVNITDGVKDPSVFTPPAICDTAPFTQNVQLPPGSKMFRGRGFLTL
ncbi:hypothetical protein ScPMuIL_004857 [Solemya velum]